MPSPYDLLIIGGGASGCFAAIQVKERLPSFRVLLLESSPSLLKKLKISGGGRCNVTHECNEISRLTQAYPRGHKELKSLFSQFKPEDMRQWLLRHGVKTKVESDGRVFPVTDRSETIIHCFIKNLNHLQVERQMSQKVLSIQKNDFFQVQTREETFKSRYLLLATGSTPSSLTLATQLGHSLENLRPSLFSFNIKDARLDGLQGISVPVVQASLPNLSAKTPAIEGPLLVTHWGLSGPALLKLSAWAALECFEKNYKLEIKVDWLPETNQEQLRQDLARFRSQAANKKIWNEPIAALPKRLWQSLCRHAGLTENCTGSQISNTQVHQLIETLKNSRFQTQGKTTYKEEFVTAGGVRRSEIDFRNMESQFCSKLFLTGEMIDVDAITGGFNFQHCWSGAYVVAKSIQEKEALTLGGNSAIA